jgi:hypothetical protein
MHLSTSAAAWIAIGAAAAAVVSLLVALASAIVLRRVRQAQLVLVGGGKSDLVDFAVSLQARIDDLHRSVDELAAGVERIDRRVDDTVSKTAIVRYDAYDNSGGHQSASVALLDSARTGVVLSAIQGRDYARIYVRRSTAAGPRSPSRPRSSRRSSAPCRRNRGGTRGSPADPLLRPSQSGAGRALRRERGPGSARERALVHERPLTACLPRARGFAATRLVRLRPSRLRRAWSPAFAAL